MFEKFKGLSESHRPTGFRKDERPHFVHKPPVCFHSVEPLESHLPDTRLNLLQMINFR